VAALERLLLALLVARQVRGRRAELARGLAGREAGDPSVREMREVGIRSLAMPRG
jgi:hypothetical protein